MCTPSKSLDVPHMAIGLTAASLKRPDIVLVNATIHGPVVSKDEHHPDAALAGLINDEVQTHQDLVIIDACGQTYAK